MDDPSGPVQVPRLGGRVEPEKRLPRRSSGERRPSISGRRNSVLESIGALDKHEGERAQPAPLVRRRSSFAITDVRNEVLDKFRPVEEPGFQELGFSPWHRRGTQRCLHLRENTAFKTFITLIIFMAGVLVGVQTYTLSPPTERRIAILDAMVLSVFCLEVLIKLIAEGKRPHSFFADGWNTFDFLIVVASLLPFDSGAVTILRLIRLLRVLKLVRALPQLRILVIGLLKSLSSIGYIGLLLLLLFYLYAVLGVSLYGPNDPLQLGTLHIALVTLFRCATLEDWTDVMYTAIYSCDSYGYDDDEGTACDHPSAGGVPAALFFVSFIVLSNMMILNLFIGVITSSMSEAKADLEAEMEAEAQEGAKGGGAYQRFMEQRLEEIVETILVIAEELDQYAVRDEERRFAEKIARKKKAVTAFGDLLAPSGGGASSSASSAAKKEESPAKTSVWGRFSRATAVVAAASPTPAPRRSSAAEPSTAASSASAGAHAVMTDEEAAAASLRQVRSMYSSIPTVSASPGPALTPVAVAFAPAPVTVTTPGQVGDGDEGGVPPAALFMRGPPLFVDVNHHVSGRRVSRPRIRPQTTPTPVTPTPVTPLRPEVLFARTDSLGSEDLEDIAALESPGPLQRSPLARPATSSHSKGSRF